MAQFYHKNQHKLIFVCLDYYFTNFRCFRLSIVFLEFVASCYCNNDNKTFFCCKFCLALNWKKFFVVADLCRTMEQSLILVFLFPSVQSKNSVKSFLCFFVNTFIWTFPVESFFPETKSMRQIPNLRKSPKLTFDSAFYI